jgi:hypothetical protein
MTLQLLLGSDLSVLNLVVWYNQTNGGTKIVLTINQIIQNTPRPPQHQGSIQEQMIELKTLAIYFGLYDADDWLQTNFFAKGRN